MPIGQHLSILEAAGLVRLVETQPELEYLFRHALIRDAAYASLVRSNRRALHRAVAEALEHLYAAGLAERAAILAYHYERAEAPAQAWRYFSMAADQARAAYANSEAIILFRAAIEQAERARHTGADAPLAGLQEQLGGVLELTGDIDAARAAYEAGLDQVTGDNRVGGARLQRKIGRCWHVRLRPTEAAQAYDRAERMLGAEPGDPAAAWWQEWLRLQLDRMEWHYRKGEWTEIASLLESARPAFGQYGTPALRFLFHDNLISIAERRNRYVISPAVLDNARAMLAAAQESGELRLIGEGHFQLGFCLLQHDDFEEAEAHLLGAEDILRRIGEAIILTYVLTYLSVLYRRWGKLEAARAYTLQSHSATQANHVTPHLAVAEGNLAWLDWRAGKFESAEAHGRAAIELWPRAAFVYPFHWVARLPLLAVALHNGLLAEAIEHARAMLEPTQQRLPDVVDGPLARAVALFEQGQNSPARSALQAGLVAAEELRYL